MGKHMKIESKEAYITCMEDLDEWFNFIKLCFQDIMTQKNAPAVLINCQIIESKK